MANWNINLTNFFIFNPKFAKNEGEEEKKILYYYPADVENDVQLKCAGLCEALIKFTSSFQPEKSCEVFTTEKTKQFLVEPEPGFWMAMTVSAGPSNGKKPSDPSDRIPENICDAVLRLSYRMFYILSGSMDSIMGEETDEGIQKLREALTKFFQPYLSSLNLDSCSILDVFHGMQYLPLGREPFLHVQSFINNVQVQFPAVRHSAFLYNDHLVWSGIDLEDMQVLYQYLVKTLLPAHPDLELQGGSLPGSSPTSTVHYGSFVTGPADLMDDVISSTNVPKVYLHCNTGITSYHLVVYRALSATLCLFLPESTVLSLDLFKALDNFIGPRLTTLVSEISEHCVRNGPNSTTESSVRFIYFNKLNLAIKSSVLEARKGGPPVLSPEVMNLLASLHADKSLCCDNGEFVLNTINDTWIVVKFCNGREFYVVTQKKPSLREISAEIKKICNTQLRGIFFLT